MANQYTSLKVVIDKILRDTLFNGLNFEAAIDYCIQFIEITGVPNAFIDKFAEVEIEDHKGPLPTDFVDMIQLYIHTRPARYNTDTIDDYSLVRTQNNYAYDHHKFERSVDDTYSIKDGIIYTSIRCGKIRMSYRAIMLDDDGYPMIPQDSNFYDALQKYIELQWIRNLWRHQKVSQAVYDDAMREYTWSVGHYRTNALMPDISKMESLINMWSTLIPRTTEFNRRFRNEGSKEIIRRH